LSGEGTSDEDIAKQRAAFCLFNIGSASCLGQEIAYLVLGAFVSMMVWRYDIRVVGGRKVGEKGKNRAERLEFRERGCT